MDIRMEKDIFILFQAWRSSNFVSSPSFLDLNNSSPMVSYSERNEANDARIGVLYRLHSCIVDVTSYRLSNLKKLNCSHSSWQRRCHSCLMYVV